MVQTDSIFLHKTDAALREFVARCGRFRDLDPEAVCSYASGALRYYKGDTKARDTHIADMTLETRWYASLQAGKPDYSVYDDDRYVADLWACWVIYSRRYLLDLQSPRLNLLQAIGSVRHVVDLGCGCGYTTAGLKEIFPDATVYGTNLPNTLQFAVGSQLGTERSFRIVPSVHEIEQRPIDLVFGSEYFEHLDRPIEHLEDVLNRARPRVLILANAFGARSTGHFPCYYHKQAVIRNDQIGRFFNKAMRWYGYVPLKTKLWNNRPAYWVRPTVSSSSNT